ncbi:MAG: Rdx family protein [Anaerolineae bacterium]
MPKAVSLTERLLGEFKNKIEECTLQPSSGGRFEVSVDGEQVFSKAETGRFPTADEIRAAVSAKM